MLRITALLVFIITFGESQNIIENNGFSRALSDFTLQLEKGLRQDGENLFVSPLGLLTALGMVYLGAKDASAQQIYQGLSFDEFSNSPLDAMRNLKTNLGLYKSSMQQNYTINLANELFLQDGFEILLKYQNDMEHYYSAPIQQVDFAQRPQTAANTINRWVNDNTQRMIKELFKAQDIQPNWKLVLANAIYFHGFWENSFNPRLTAKEPFATLDGSQVETSFMNIENTLFAYKEFPQIAAKVLQMNYIGKDIKMTIVLPDETSGLYEVLGDLNVEILQQMLGNLNRRKLNVKFPKFKFQAEYDDTLMRTLRINLGISDIFDAGKADLSGITSEQPLFVQLIKHIAVVDVDEKGTKAAAVTGIAMVATSLFRPDPPLDFFADHPFMFIISDNRNGAILFCGTYVKPPL